jgi:hypothetical protein
MLEQNLLYGNYALFTLVCQGAFGAKREGNFSCSTLKDNYATIEVQCFPLLYSFRRIGLYAKT